MTTKPPTGIKPPPIPLTVPRRLPAVQPHVAAPSQSSTALVRDYVLNLSAKKTRRHSPSSPTSAAFRATLTFDAQGHFLTPEESAGREDIVWAEVMVQHGRIRFDPATLQSIRIYCQSDATPQAMRTAAQILANFHGFPLSETAPSQPALNAPTGAIDVLEGLRPGHVERMRDFIISSIENIGTSSDMTFQSNLASMFLLPSALQGRIDLDPRGHIQGFQFSQPDYRSPRGTVYESGLKAGSMGVDVILDSRSKAIVHYTLPQEGNYAQTQAMQALLELTREQRERFLNENPFFEQILNGTDEGRWLMEISSHLRMDREETKVTYCFIVPTLEGSYRIENKEHTSAVASFQMAVSCGHRKPTAHFEMLLGEVPEQMLPVLAWVVKKLNTPLP